MCNWQIDIYFLGQIDHYAQRLYYTCYDECTIYGPKKFHCCLALRLSNPAKLGSTLKHVSQMSTLKWANSYPDTSYVGFQRKRDVAKCTLVYFKNGKRCETFDIESHLTSRKDH